MDLRCDGEVCSGLERQDPVKAMKCTKARVTDEDIDGCKSNYTSKVDPPSYPANLSVGLDEIPGVAMSA